MPEVTKSKSKVKYYDIPCSFDIETSSFYQFGQKRCCMYVWQLGIMITDTVYVILGRTWEQFKLLCEELSKRLELTEDKRLICFIHNFGYEFNWTFQRLFNWLNVFCMDERKPLYAMSDIGFEFRCSYLLSGYALVSLAKNLNTWLVAKKVGELDYNLIRHSETPLTNNDIDYCVEDVVIVCCYISELIDQYGALKNLPLTNTGFVRNFCREKCLFTDGMSRKKSKLQQKYRDYRALMKELALSPDEYQELKRAFGGGFTHACPWFVGKVVEDVTSWDETSAYPYSLVAELYPMGRGEYVKIESANDFIDNLKHYCCLFDVRFTNMRSKVLYDNYVSVSHCWYKENVTSANGRLVDADTACMTITEQDYIIIRKTYEWDEMQVRNFIRYPKGYLPTDLVDAILTLYENKTTLKDVAEFVVEYMRSKGMLNATYGCMVTDIVRDVISYLQDNEEKWHKEQPDLNKEINRYNGSQSRFNFYAWGVWCTAYSRKHLWQAIVEFGSAGHYIYSDTDSVKVIHTELHQKWLEDYNKACEEKLTRAMNWHGFSVSRVKPKTVKGKEKLLGVFDFDGHYKKFKTLGAKRYMVQYDDDSYSITVSGINKYYCVPWLVRVSKRLDKSPFDLFDDGLRVPEFATGKKTHTYIDERMTGYVRDYLGNWAKYDELCGVHMSGATYDMKMSQDFVDYLENVKYSYSESEDVC